MLSVLDFKAMRVTIFSKNGRYITPPPTSYSLPRNRRGQHYHISGRLPWIWAGVELLGTHFLCRRCRCRKELTQER